MKPTAFLVAALILSPFLALAGPPSAEETLAPAKQRAAKEKKAIFLHFGASWCGWCKKLDAFLDKPEIKPVYETYFVPVKLVVQENEANKKLENPGADALLKKLGGPAGLPYFAFLDPKGNAIVTSKHEGANIGFPAQPGEIDWFVEMIKKAAPAISEHDLKAIETTLRASKT